MSSQPLLSPLTSLDTRRTPCFRVTTILSGEVLDTNEEGKRINRMCVGIITFGQVSDLLSLHHFFFWIAVLNKTLVSPDEPTYLLPPNAHHHGNENLRKCWVVTAASLSANMRPSMANEGTADSP